MVLIALAKLSAARFPKPEVVVLDDDVQPAVATSTNAQIKSNGSAFFNGILMYRFIILAIGFIFYPIFCPTVGGVTTGSSLILMRIKIPPIMKKKKLITQKRLIENNTPRDPINISSPPRIRLFSSTAPAIPTIAKINAPAALT